MGFGVSGKESEAPGGPARGGRLGQAPHIKKPARTRRGLLPGSLAGWLITCFVELRLGANFTVEMSLHDSSGVVATLE
jgi:hypothetical protein